MIDVILCSTIVLLLFYFLFFERKPEKCPRGPPSFPIVGSIPYLSEDLVQSFNKLSEKYGNIFSLRIGSFDAIVLNNHKDIRDAFKDDVMNGRPQFHLIQARCEGNNGILFADGPDYQEMRRFTLRHLKDLGFGRSTLESTVVNEVKYFEESLRRYDGQAQNLQNKFNISVINALWTIITGERFALDDPRANGVIEKLNCCVQSASLASPRHFFPYLRHIWPPVARDLEFRLSLISSIKNILNESIREHQTDIEERKDFIGVFLEHVKKSESDSPFYNEKGIVQLRVILLDLFMAGAETTSTSLTWFFLLMALNPEIQKKVQNEIDEVVGRDRKPSMDDRSRLKYTEACIQETLRFVSLVPFVTHKVHENVQFGDFVFQKDTLLFGNIHNALHDPTIWQRPEEFFPEHFLQETKIPDAFMPFGTGKRICLGETLARMELFLFVTHLLHSFTFSLKDGDVPRLDPVNPNAIVRSPEPHELIISSR